MVQLQFGFEYRYVRVCDGMMLNNKRAQLINEVDALKGMTSVRKLKQLEHAEIKRMQREQKQTTQKISSGHHQQQKQSASSATNAGRTDGRAAAAAGSGLATCSVASSVIVPVELVVDEISNLLCPPT
uniref:Uncharacterized protein n=1 Tax=Globodera rostochiensis TaxID=31243 RepID=A0A914IFP2_GLORO